MEFLGFLSLYRSVVLVYLDPKFGTGLGTTEKGDEIDEMTRTERKEELGEGIEGVLKVSKVPYLSDWIRSSPRVGTFLMDVWSLAGVPLTKGSLLYQFSF